MPVERGETAGKRAREKGVASTGGKYKSGIIKQFRGNPQQNSQECKFQSFSA